VSGARSEPVSGTLVVRDQRVAYASAGAGAVLGRVGRDILGRPLAELLAEAERERVAERLARLLRGEPVPDEYEVVLRLPDGAHRTVQAHASLEGTDEIVLQLRDLSDQAEQRRRLGGLAELGVAIQRERTEAAIFERVRHGLGALGLSSLLMRPEESGARVDWAHLPERAEAAFVVRLGRPVEGFLVAWNAFSRTAWEKGVGYSDDWIMQVLSFLPPQLHAAARALAASESLVRALAVRLDERSGAARYLVVAGGWLGPGDAPALRLFGAQVTAALDSATAIAALSARNFDLAALNRLGELASGVAGLDEFLPRAGEVVRATACCEGMAVVAAEPASNSLTTLYAVGAEPPPEAARPAFEALAATALAQRRLQVVQRAEVDPALAAWMAAAGLETLACVPLVVRSRALGAMVTAWHARRDEAACRPDLLLAMGAHFAAAMEAHGLLSDLRRRVDELTLLNDLAVATATLDPVLLLENALRRVCDTFDSDGAAAYLVEGGALELTASMGLAPGTAALIRRLDLTEGPAGHALERRLPVTELTPEQMGARCAEAQAREGMRVLVAVPLVAKTRAVGALCLGRRSARPFARGDVGLLTAIGVQLGVAVEAARQHADTRRRARDLEAINSLAMRVFGSPPGDLKALLQVAAGEMARALGSRQVVITLLDPDGQVLRPVAWHGEEPPPEARAVRLAGSQLATDAIRTGVPTFTLDVSRDPRSALAGLPGVKPVALLVVPLAARGQSRGAIFVGQAPGHHFGEADLGLATALGGELALALENAELHAGARRSLSELTAIVDMARALSSSLDLDRVLEIGAEHLRQTLAGDRCTVLLADVRAGVLRRAAHCGPPLERESVPLEAPSLARDALTTRAPVAGSLPEGVPGAGAALLAVPLRVRDQAQGVALVADPGPERRFGQGELARAMAIASQLAVAVDNARLYQEARRRAEELSLLQEVGRTLVASLELGQVLDAGVKNLARIVDAPEAYLVLLEADGSTLEVKAVAGPRLEELGRRLPATPEESLAGLVLHRREAVVVDDAAADPRVKQSMRARTGARAYLGLPLLVQDRPIGAAVIVETERPRHFSPAEVQRAGAIANQLAVAVDHARAHARTVAALADLQAAQEKLLRQERLAALGELSAVVAHEVRNPLGVIFNSLGSIRRLLKPEGDAKMLLDIVGEESDRLNRIVGDLLDFARPASPSFRPERLERVVDEAVAVALSQAGGTVTLTRACGADLPEVPLDARLVRQAVLNVAVNAVQAMPRGGRLAVRLRTEGRFAVVELEDGGPGIAADVRGRIFEPFFTTKATGTGLGLAVVKRIVEGHGGEVGVGDAAGRGTVFSLRFPLQPAPADVAPVESRPGMR